MKDKSLLYLLIAALLIAGALRVDFIMYIAYVAAGLWAFSRWYTPRALRNFKVVRRFDPNAFLGDKVPVTVSVTNQGRLPMPWVQVEEMTAPMLRSGTEINDAVHIGGGETVELTYAVRAQKRGYYRVGPMRFQFGDIFGFREEKGIFPPDFITVYPRIVPLEQLRLPSRLPFGTLPSKQRLYEDPARPIGVRAFRSGDSLRQINWKVSGRYANAASGGLMVKTLEPAISLETLLLVDLDREGFEARQFHEWSEWAIVVAASLASHLVGMRQGVGLATNGYDPLASSFTVFDEATGKLLDTTGNVVSDADAMIQPSNFIPPRNGRRHLMSVLELLARIESKRTQTWFGDFAMQATLNLSWGTTVIAITPRADDKITDTLHRLVKAGFNPILFCIQPVANFGEVQQTCQQLGFRAHLVLNASELGMEAR